MTPEEFWIPFDKYKKSTHPTEYGKYLIVRKDGKIHWETWNGSGWAYNLDEIRGYANIPSGYHLMDKKYK